MAETETNRPQPEGGASSDGDSTDLHIGRSLGLRTTQLGSAFEREHRNLLWQRTRLVLAIGLANALIWVMLTLFVPLAEPVTEYGAREWNSWLDLLYPISFAVGLVYIYAARPGVAGLQTAAFLVIAANVIASLVQISFSEPDMISGFGIGLALFVPAAFIPWRLRYQVALAVVRPSWRP